ncbi:hypothetical protein KFK09_000807 [Dendrobium nobile]|uniref:Retrovirus-related Pol polyprotein from transposon TNT 1-94 n=1 Tax=Dendrobium nobile TaxID=94219 RepID=A0A8T3C9J1_DENNO|nr:hypothetical protein KFK09_000807 [Dendrobium nobile]
MSNSSNSSTNMDSTNPASQLLLPPKLIFLISNLKKLVPTSLTPDTYQIWRSQVEKIFTANGFKGFLDRTSSCPTTSTEERDLWILTDQNLSVALYSVISTSILPYVLSLTHCSEIWQTLANRLQSTTRSRVIQLKNDLHHLSKGDKTMTNYLLEIKSKVDLIAAAGCQIDPEDVILYTLNGLPATYQAFKTAIRTNLQPLSLDDLYSLLCMEEQNLIQEAANDLQQIQLSDNTTALLASRGRGRERSNSYRGKRGRGSSQNANRGDR